MSRNKRYYQIIKNNRSADINIYGDITSYEWNESDVSSYSVKSEIDELDVDEINVYINSYGGEVAEALAIYSALKRHRARVHTYCDGFACSAATIIFCAGDDRTMGSLALFMIHNCMMYAGIANANELRKYAEDADTINQSSIEAYKKVSNLSEDDIKAMMDAETWLTARECLGYGFATEIAEDDSEDESVKQSAFMSVRNAVLTSHNDNLAALNEKMDKITSMLEKELKNDSTASPEPQKVASEVEQPDEETETAPEVEPEESKQNTLLEKAAKLFGSIANK